MPFRLQELLAKVGVSGEFGLDPPPDTKKQFFQKSSKNHVPPPLDFGDGVDWPTSPKASR